MLKQAKTTEDLFIVHLFWIFVTWSMRNLLSISRRVKEESCSGREDNVKDDNWYKAVFMEHGASASQVAAARVLDTMSPLQIFGVRTSQNDPRLLRLQAWILIPSGQRPTQWDTI